MPISIENVVRLSADASFGRPLVSNIYRGLIAEVLVSSELSSGWTHCSADWNGWDFVHEDGCKLEVKQSAALQSWASDRPSPGVFSISPSKGFWAGALWTASIGRPASIYVFAWHSETDREVADHRDATQWRFLVLPESILPKQSTISLSVLNKLSASFWKSMNDDRSALFDIAALGSAVDTILKLHPDASRGLTRRNPARTRQS